jgi:phosphohistidine phosphatase
MELYLIRHADALALGEGGITEDADRPLSPSGIEQARRLGRALREKELRVGVVLTSPLLRARQTAEEMLGAWNSAPPELRICDELAPGGRPKRLARLLRSQGSDAIALVGHQPDLSGHTAWLVGSKKAQIDIVKAGVAFVVCDGRPGKGGGVLEWLLTPDWLGA